ncbi:MAG: DUF3857 domain-containing protein [Lacunisphaera sp.]
MCPTLPHNRRFIFRCPSFVWFFVLLLIAAPAVSGEEVVATKANLTPATGPAPSWVLPTEWTAPTQARENSSGEDFLLLDEQHRLASNEDYQHRVFQIVTDGGRQGSSQVYFHFDPSYQKLIIHQLKLIRGKEVFDRLDMKKLQVIQQERDLDSQLYNGQRSALQILDDVRVGDIIDVAYTLQGANPVFEGKFIDTSLLDWSVPVRVLNYRVLVPAGRTISSRVQGPAQASFNVQLRDGEQDLSWRRTDAPIVESENAVPSSHVVFSFLDLSEFRSWHDVVQWAVPLYALDDRPRPLLAVQIAEIRRHASTAEIQAVAALAFVQEQIRYLGIEMGPGSHRPSDPEEVLRRRFGDCKDKARLLTALLRGLGLEAAPALVHSSRREAVLDRLPTPYAFDHVVVALDLNSRRYIIDPTLAYQRGDRLELRHVGRYGPYLRVAATTTALETPALGPFDTNAILLKETFQVTALEKPATLTVVTVTAGRGADSLRLRFATNTSEQIGREYLDYYTRYYPGITQEKAIETVDDPRGNTFTSTEHYLVKNLFPLESNGELRRAEFQPGSIWDYARTPNLAQRKQPYAINHPTQVEQRTIINLPEDWIVTPNDEKITDPAFSLQATAKNESPRQVVIDYHWASTAFSVETARLGEFADNAAKARKTLGYQLTWRVPGATPPSAKPAPAVTTDTGFPLNWPMVALAACVLAIGAHPSWRLVKRRNPTPPEPPLLSTLEQRDPFTYLPRPRENLEGLGGWLILVAVGLFVRPSLYISAIYGARRAYFNQNVWQLLTTTTSKAYNPNFGMVAPLELIYNFAMLGCSILLLILFFRRSHLFPRFMQVFLGCIVLGSLFAIWDSATISHKPVNALDFETMKIILQAVIAAAVWIPYFQVSRRVKATFTR